jgi:PHD/YefM family antitoxin component YafN of YafNO toxin-antitoxin module
MKLMICILCYNRQNRQKGKEMQTVTATNLKQNSMILQNALREDLLVTKRDKPFVVVMDFKKYQAIEKYINNIANDETYTAISNLEANNNEVITYTSKDKLFNDLGL